MGRFERKYRLTAKARAFLLAYWRPFVTRAQFTNRDAVYPVLSQYFDSRDLVFRREKYAGVGFRKKIRLRTYGYRLDAGSPCFLEIKWRTNEAVSKTRLPLPSYHPDYLDPARWQDLEGPGADLFASYYETHWLRPSAQTFYLREAYESLLDPGLRVTFDSYLIGLHPGEVLSRSLLYERSRMLIPETVVILEVKGRGQLPRWIRRGVQWCNLQQETVPKYVMAVDALNLVNLSTGIYA